MSAMVIFLNPCPDTLGHYRFLDVRGRAIDTASGPRKSMLRIYHSSGYDVRDLPKRDRG